MPRHRSVQNLSIADLEQILESRRAELQRQRDELAEKLAALDAEIAGKGAPRRRPGRPPRAASVGGTGRRKNAKSLPNVIADVLAKHGKMKVADLVQTILNGGFHTSSANFRSIVNQALIKNRHRFAHAERGFYTLSK